MKFGLVHRIMTDALAALGLLSLLTSGELERSTVVLFGVGLALSVVIPERWQTHPRMRTLSVIASLSLLASQTLRLAWGHDVLKVAVEFAAGLQLIRLSTRRGAAHDQQIILLALLHLVAGTVFGGGLAYGMCFLGFLVIAPGALVLSHLRREVEGNYRQGARDRTGLPVDVPRILRSRRVISKRFLAATCSLSVPIFVFTALLFVLFPRVGLSLLLLNHQRSERMIGFSDRVDLGKVGRLRTDSTIAARVYLNDLPPNPPLRIPLYLRGTAFDTYDGFSWSRDRTQFPARKVGSRVWVMHPNLPLGEEVMTIDLQPIKPPVLFLPANAAAFDVLTRDDKLLGRPPKMTRGREGDFEYLASEERGIRYKVLALDARARAFEHVSDQELQRYLTVPPDLPERIRELARDWVGAEEDTFAAAKRVEHRLRTEYVYDLNSPSGAQLNPLDHFLFESKRGHCEFYSTSMAILLRTLGVPTRNVTGFIGGTYNRFGEFYAVRQGDAHSWVEVYLEGRGWTAFDPTPASESAPRAEVGGMIATLRDLMEATSERWNRHVVGYDLQQQLDILRDVRKRWPRRDERLFDKQHRGFAMVALLLVGGVAVGFWLYRRRRSPSKTPASPTPLQQDSLRMVKLYQLLEEVMRAHGVPRKPDVPPLAHARALQGIGHPLGDEVLDLTWIYQRVRFGGSSISDAALADYAARVKRLKTLEVSKAA